MRVEELLKSVEMPPELKHCRFEVRQRYQYSSKKAYSTELERLGHGTTAVEQITAVRPGNLSFTWFGGLQDVDESAVMSKNSPLLSRKPKKNAMQKIRLLRDTSIKEQKGNDDEFLRYLQ